MKKGAHTKQIMPEEIESRRADYRKLADVFLTMIDLECNRVESRLAIHLDDPLKDNPSLLINAIEEHLSIAYHAVDWYSKEGMNLYVELRLLAYQQEQRRKRDYHKAWRGRDV